MKIENKTGGKILLGYIGVQVLAVGVGLYHHYSQPQIISFAATSEAIEYSWNDILYGAIRNPHINHPISPAQSSPKEFKISLIGATTGTSGDCVLTIPIA